MTSQPPAAPGGESYLPANGQQQTTLLPRPDPTILTNEAVKRAADELRREIEATREVLDIRIQGRAQTVDTRLDGMDKAIVLLQTATDRMPAKVGDAIGSLKELHERQFGERFEAIQQQIAGLQRQIEEAGKNTQRQFEERDVRTDQTSLAAKEAVATAFQASKEAVAAALQAAKEAVAAQNESFSQSTLKSETTTSRLLEQLGVQINTATGALNDKIDDIKSRLTAMEGKATGVATTTTTQQSNNSYTVAMVGLVVGTLIAVGSLVISLAR